MPNTLVHLAAQPLLTPCCWRSRGAWTLLIAMLGATLPDVPWIIQRAVRQIYQAIAPSPGIDGDLAYAHFRLYFGVQSSLVFCWILALAVALATRKPARNFSILALGSVVHLALDSLQVKWANGVLWFAPFDWRLHRLDLVWPESVATDIATALSAVVLLNICWHLWRSPPTTSLLTAARWPAAVTVGLVWCLSPLAFTESLRSADAYSIAALTDARAPLGQRVELGSARVFERNGQLWVRTLTERQLPLLLTEVVDEHRQFGPGKVSLKGTLVASPSSDPLTRIALQVTDSHQHRVSTREILNIAGLSLLAALLSFQQWRATRRRV